MKKHTCVLKTEKGAITLVVLIGMLLLTFFLMSVYVQLSNKAQISKETTKQIREQYNNIGDKEKIYENYFSDMDTIPIYTVEQLRKIGTGEQLIIDGKKYTFSSDAYYILKRDLDLGGVYNEESKTWTGKTWEPITNNFTGTLDGFGHKITGIYLGENENTQGVFKELNGTIKNVYVKNSYKVKNTNGLLAGTNNGKIIDSYYEKIIIGLKVGDYVNYTPETGTYTVASGANGSGWNKNQTFKTDATLKWRVWSIDEETGKIELISEKAVHSLIFKGANGYNHAVDILNDLCKTLYSNKDAAVARSINVEDINAKTTYDYTKYTYLGMTYGDKINMNKCGTNAMKYPNLYSQEKGFGLAGTFSNTLTGLDENKGLENGTIENGVTTYKTVTGYTDGNANGTEPWVTYTYYGLGEYYPENCLNTDLEINSVPEGLINLGVDYYLASRCVYVYYDGKSDIRFGIRRVTEKGCVKYYCLFYGNGTELNPSDAVRPIVCLEKNFSLSNDTKNTTESVTYWDVNL